MSSHTLICFEQHDAAWQIPSATTLNAGQDDQTDGKTEYKQNRDDASCAHVSLQG